MGSTTDAVLQWLCNRPSGRWTENSVIERALVVPGRKPGTVRWSLVYLRQIGLVEASGDAARNARYLKYRVTPKGLELKR